MNTNSKHSDPEYKVKKINSSEDNCNIKVSKNHQIKKNQTKEKALR